ncbi:MAG TPA: hypothetical protein DCS21_02415, partial [Gammaproteobacteria bacterium]|nr:hypothetical protein [Gammaproteobacteria bacterium]
MVMGKLGWTGLAMLLMVASEPMVAETLVGRVVAVHDGDTVMVLVAGQRRVRVRLAQIDAPERD